MTVLATAKDRLTDAVRGQSDRYAPGEDRPLRGYATTMAVYTCAVGAIAEAVKVSRTSVPDGLPVTDIALSAAATYKLSRLLTRDPVTSPLRAPFTTYQGTAGPAELSEDVRGHSGRKTVGELLTCPFCIGMWVATGLTAGMIFAPRATRLATATLASLVGADLLHYGHSLLDKAAS